MRSYPDIADVKQSVFESRGVFDEVHELGAHEQGVPEKKTGFTIQIHQESVAALGFGFRFAETKWNRAFATFVK